MHCQFGLPDTFLKIEAVAAVLASSLLGKKKSCALGGLRELVHDDRACTSKF